MLQFYSENWYKIKILFIKIFLIMFAPLSRYCITGQIWKKHWNVGIPLIRHINLINLLDHMPYIF